MATYGSLRLLIQKENPGVDLELIDSYIQTRYTEILDQLPWKRQEADSVIQSPASYQTGTLTATQGSTSITGVGTTWTSAMTGLMIRIANTEEYYQFTYVSATSGTLDRGWEQPTGSLLAYRIDQAVFLLPADCRILRGVTPLHDRVHGLRRVTPAELAQMAPQRRTYGAPAVYCQTWDSFSDPPQMQVELYPVPSAPNSAGVTPSFVVDYSFDAAQFSASAVITSASLLPWVRPGALQAAVRADCLRLAKDWNGAAAMDTRAKELVQAMLKINAAQRGPQQIRTAAHLKRQDPNRRHRRWHEGYTG